MKEPESSVEYCVDRGRTVVAWAAGALFVGGGVWLVTQGLLEAVLGVACIVFGGWVIVAIGRRLLVGGWTMRADARGVSFGPASYLAGLSIPWSAIEEIGVMTTQRQKSLGVALLDPAAVAGSVSAATEKRAVRQLAGVRVLGGTALASSMLLGKLFLRGETADSTAKIMTSRLRSMTEVFATSRDLWGFDIGLVSSFLNAPIDEVVATLNRIRRSS